MLATINNCIADGITFHGTAEQYQKLTVAEKAKYAFEAKDRMYDAILKEVRSEIHKGASAALFAGDLEARRGEIGERLRAGSGA